MPTNRDDEALKKLKKLGQQLEDAKAASKETLKVVENAKQTNEQVKRDLKLLQRPADTKRKRKRKPANR